MAALLRWEWGHWSTRPDVRIAALAVPVLSLLLGWLSAFALRSDLVPAFLSGSEPTGFALAYRSAKTMHTLLAMLLLLWSTASIAAEAEAGQLRAVLLRVPRAQLLLAKALHLWLVAAALSLLITVISLAMGALQFGLQPVEVASLTIHSRASLLLSGLVAFAINLLPTAALIALGVCLSSSGLGSRAATTLGLFAALMLWSVAQIPSIASFSFLSFWARPFVVAVDQAEGFRTEAHTDDLLALLLSCSTWTLICLALALRRFLRRDLT